VDYSNISALIHASIHILKAQVGYSGTLLPYFYYDAHSRRTAMALQLADIPPRPLNGHFLGETLDKDQHSFRPLTAPRLSSNGQKSSAIISKIPQDMFAMSPAPKLQSFHRRKFRATPCLAAEDAHLFFDQNLNNILPVVTIASRTTFCHFLDALCCSPRKHMGLDR